MKAHPGGRPRLHSLRDPNTVAAIIDALRLVYVDAVASLMLTVGMTLADRRRRVFWVLLSIGPMTDDGHHGKGKHDE